MQVYTNEKFIERRANIGRRTSMIGLGILLVGMLASLSPGFIINWAAEGNPLATSALAQWLAGGGWLYVSMITLLIGFALGQMGNANMRRFQKSPRPDQVVAKALKGFDDRNHLYLWSTPGDIVFAGPAGVYTIVTRDLDGEINIKGDRARQPFSLRRFFLAFGSEAGGMPALDAQDAAKKLTSWMGEQIEGEDPESLEIRPLVVFTNDRAQLNVESSSAPIIHQKQLKQYLRNELRSSRLSKTTLGEMIEALDAEAQRRGAELES